MITDIIKTYAAELIQNYIDQMPSNYAIRDKITFSVFDKGSYNYQIVIDLPAYWKYIERGRRAYPDPSQVRHNPPVSAIREWIKVRNISPKNFPQFPKLTEQSLPYMLSNSIRKKGIEPKPFLRNAINSTDLDSLRANMKSAMIAEINNYLFPK